MPNNPKAADNLTAPRFEPGQSGNPGGKTKAQREAEVQAAEDSAILRAMMTKGLLEKARAGEDVLQYLDPTTLKLFKDSEDRAHGTPTQSVNVESPNGTMTPQAAVNLSGLTDKELKQLERLTNKATDTNGVGET